MRVLIPSRLAFIAVLLLVANWMLAVSAAGHVHMPIDTLRHKPEHQRIHEGHIECDHKRGECVRLCDGKSRKRYKPGPLQDKKFRECCEGCDRKLAKCYADVNRWECPPTYLCTWDGKHKLGENCDEG